MELTRRAAGRIAHLERYPTEHPGYSVEPR
jgi:hypothetical protein